MHSFSLLRTDLDPSKRQGGDLLSSIAFVPQLLVGFGLLVFIKPSSPGSVLLFLGAFLLLAPVSFSLLVAITKWRLRKDTIGHVRFDKGVIELHTSPGTQFIHVGLNDRVEIITRDRLGKATWSKYRPIHSGVVSVKLVTNEASTEFQFLVRSPAEQANLKGILQGWYRAGCQVKESYYVGQAFLLHTDLSFEQVQQVKKDYGLVELWPVSKRDPSSA